MLWLRWLPQRRDRVHSTIVESAAGFAEQVALVLEVALAQDDRARLAVFEDRDRIGRDLHDLVIQRLFAIGLTLDNTTRLAGPGRVADRISTAVDQLDETIKDIRRTIFELANPDRPADLRDDLEATVTAMLPSLGFRPQLRTAGAVHSGVSDDIRPHLLAVLREALSNVGRHARAQAATVTLRGRAGHRTDRRRRRTRHRAGAPGQRAAEPAGAGRGTRRVVRGRTRRGRSAPGWSGGYRRE